MELLYNKSWCERQKIVTYIWVSWVSFFLCECKKVISDIWAPVVLKVQHMIAPQVKKIHFCTITFAAVLTPLLNENRFKLPIKNNFFSHFKYTFKNPFFYILRTHKNFLFLLFFHIKLPAP